MLYIGIDLGTSAVKLLLMDGEGAIKNIVSKEYPLEFPQPGWSQQNPEDWKKAVLEGIPELLATLKAQEVKVAVLSNKPHAETVNVIETLFGEGYFDIIQGQKEDVAIKPSPEGVYRILEQLCLTAEETLYLGDTATDMKTGKNAGIFTVGALWGFREREELEQGGADALIGYPLELLRYT